MLYALFIAVLIAADQIVKYLVRARIPLFGSLPFIPHIMELTYVQNTGAAFSMLDQHTWLLTLISAVVSVILAWVLLSRRIRHPAGLIPLCAVFAGAVGNLIDRMLFGFVTDMFQTIFIRFAVFNVADICVTCGGAVFCIYFLFFYDKLEPKEPAHDHHPTDP